MAFLIFTAMIISHTEENYLKSIYLLAHPERGKIPNFSIAQHLNINPATVTEMLKKLAEKKWIDYSRADGATLTAAGQLLALHVIRKHRLWETFLVQHLNFTWDEVHEVAEQLEHIQSQKLLDQLSIFLGHPEFDPHGDPIPNQDGLMPTSQAVLLSDCQPGELRKFVAVANHSPSFLQYLSKVGFHIQQTIEIEDVYDFDMSMHVILNGDRKTVFSAEVAKCLLVI